METLKPFFTYFGGKFRSAPRYPSPKFSTIIEPFAGSAGYSLRYPQANVMLFDTNPLIAGLWQYLINVSESEILQLPDVKDDETVDDLPVCQEARWLIGFWLNKGCAAPRKSPSAWMRSKIRPNSYWGQAIRERIAKQISHIRHWKISCEHYANAPNIPVTWFIDPPYQVMGLHYTKSQLDYTVLGNWCRSRVGQVIVCEQSGANWMDFVPFENIKSTPRARQEKFYSAEVVWTNTQEATLFGV